MQIVKNKYECYGCGKCAAKCPVHAIMMIKDEEGFFYPYIDEEKCINCGMCRELCIANLDIKEREPDSIVFACVSKDKTVLERSSSGGMFYILAYHILKKGGVVYGAAYNDLRVEHVRISSVDELHRLQGSKYVQSKLHQAFELIDQDIENEKLILFSGTPCQIAAVKTYAQNYDKLYCVEIICAGCPSPMVWEKYVEEKQKELGNIRDVRFRDKITGWRSYSMAYVLEEEKIEYSSHSMDIFSRGFGQWLFFRKSCHKCRYRGAYTIGDMKIGDFWGIENYSDIYRHSNGVSLVVLESIKGIELFENVKKMIDFEEVSYKFALVYNPCLEISCKQGTNRTKFFEMCKQADRGINECIMNCLLPAKGQKDRYWYLYPAVLGLYRKHIEEGGLKKFFSENNYKNVVVYGLGELGKLFIKDLCASGVNVSCIVDRNYIRFPEQYEGIKVVGPHMLEQEEYDCIVITLVDSYDSVFDVLMVLGVDINKIISIGSIV